MPVGLRNIGNTCFMNSILQCVLLSPGLTEWMITKFQASQKHRSTPLSNSFFDLLSTVRRANGAGSVTPSDLKTQVSRTVSQFSGFGQQDAQEFLRFLLDRMHDELNRVTVKPKYQEMKFEKHPVGEQSEKWAQYYRQRDDSIMTDLFEGQLMSRVGCLSCNHQTYAFDNFLDLSIDFPRKATRFTGTISLEDCMQKFIDVEKIIDAGYKCEGCKKPVNVEKDITLYRFPKLLVIHLKRFYHSAMRREKLNTTVTFPAKGLDLRKYAPHSSKCHAELIVLICRSSVSVKCGLRPLRDKSPLG